MAAALPSTALVSRTTTELAAANLYSELTTHSQTRDLLTSVPKGGEAIVHFMIAANGATASAAHSGGPTSDFYRAATVRIVRSGTSASVTATIAEYREGAYQARAALTDYTGSAISPTVFEEATGSESALVRVDTRGDEVIIQRYPVVPQGLEAAVGSLKPEENAPIAYRIMKAVSAIFPEGLPLPRDWRAHHVTAAVFVRGSDAIIQSIQISRGVRGTHSPIGSTEAPWGSTSIERSDLGDGRIVRESFERLRDAAEGKGPPHTVPASAVLVATATGGGVARLTGWSATPALPAAPPAAPPAAEAVGLGRSGGGSGASALDSIRWASGGGR